jgi:hypothetical protein
MNKQNLKIAAQAGLQQRIDNPNEIWGYRDDLQRFAEFVRQDERAACAKLCEDLQLTDLAIRDWADGTYDCAIAIRAKGNYEQN